MIVRDRAGNASLRNRSPVAFMSSLIAGMHGDANATMNLLATGGPGAPMILGSPQRTAINLLAGASAGGGTIAQKVADLQAQGARFGTAQVEAGKSIIDSEQRTALQSSEESRLTALSDNTSSINQLSNAFAGFVARNPLGTTVAAASVPLVGQVAAGFFGRQLAGTALGTALGVAAPVAGAAAGGAAAGGAAAGGAAAGGGALAIGGAIGATVIAPLAAAAAVTLATRPLDASNARAALRADGTGGSDADMIRRFRATHAATPPPTAEQIGAALVAALRAAPITATVSPVDATHARTQAATP
jgi:hypothetical protein